MHSEGVAGQLQTAPCSRHCSVPVRSGVQLPEHRQRGLTRVLGDKLQITRELGTSDMFSLITGSE